MLLATGRGFADPFVWSSQHRIVATAFHPPLFSTFLGGIYRTGFHSVAAARVGSCLLGTATVVFVGLTGRAVGGRRVGLIAASIAALTPNLWVPDGALTSEGLATTLVAATLWLAYRFLRNPRRGTAIWLGISIGLAGLTRPETLALAAIVVVPITVHLALPIRRRQIFGHRPEMARQCTASVRCSTPRSTTASTSARPKRTAPDEYVGHPRSIARASA